MKKSIVYKKLLCYGLFPESLDGIFGSEDFGKWILDGNKPNIPQKELFSMLSYKLTRNNNAPRQMGIPHPMGYYHLCNEIRESWGKIIELFESVPKYRKTSMIVPKLNNKNKRLVSMASYDQNPDKEELQLDKQFGNKYFVKADISSCFPSIYTHSLSWALVGKSTAKKNKNHTKHWYNKLDRACQKIQDGETRGVPIGPDTSRLLSEVILCKIDEKLQNYRYIRFVDDYKCFCETKEKADKFIRDLSYELEQYRLTLNAKKTEIIPLPKTLNEDWVHKLKSYIDWKEINSFNRNKVLDFLDLSCELFRKNPSESPIRYAAKVLTNKKFKDYKTYELIMRYLFNLCFLFPYVVDICDDLINRGIQAFPIRAPEIKKILKESVQRMLKEHTKYRRSDVITWSIFLCIKYNVKLANTDSISSEILKTEDCIPTLLCYLYCKVEGKEIQAFLEKLEEVDKSEWWLYIYEVSRVEKKNLKDPNLEKLRKAKISFLSQAIIEKL